MKKTMKRLMFWGCLFLCGCTPRPNCMLQMKEVLQSCGVRIDSANVLIEGSVTASASVTTKGLVTKLLSGVEKSSEIKHTYDQWCCNIGDVKFSCTIKKTGAQANLFFISIALSQQNSEKNIYNIIGKIWNHLTLLSKSPRITFGYEGVIPEKLSSIQMKNKAGEILTAYGCHCADEIDLKGCLSFTGYSSMFPEQSMSNGSKENINVAIKCGEHATGTQLWAYYPLIQKDY